MSEKLLTLKEAAEMLVVSEEQLRRLVEKEVIPAYHIGGKYLRFKEEQVLELKSGRLKVSGPAPSQKVKVHPAHRDSLIGRLGDFFYFNDFYIFSGILIAALVYIILESIK